MNARQLKSLERIVSAVVGLAVFLTLYFVVTDATRGAEPQETSRSQEALQPQEIIRLKDFFADTVRIRTGDCALNSNGTITENAEERQYTKLKKCAFRINPGNQGKRYAVIYTDYGEVESIIEGDDTSRKQKIIWHKDWRET